MHDKVTAKKSVKFSPAKFILLFIILGVLGGLAFAGFQYFQQRMHGKGRPAVLPNNAVALLPTHVGEPQPQPQPPQPTTTETVVDEVTVQPTSMPAPIPADVSSHQAAKLQQLYVAIDNITTCNHCGDKANKQATPVRNNNAGNSFGDQVADGFKNLVKISKRDNPNGNRPIGNLELNKIQLKLLVNDMRWAWLYRDQQTYTQDINAARALLQRDFDMQDSQVQVVANLLSELST